ncbi:hypothetical protein RF11_13897 [Thelohanellus kitauei]|uniref:Uncharacterized protein n=1 Tax=Thelohanellus kitauei TaxID=669202 RepID=A0A0C2M9C2_THEKT|nr:hypothetical protein RF11_13897 [Thelohanellus kitauei]
MGYINLVLISCLVFLESRSEDVLVPPKTQDIVVNPLEAQIISEAIIETNSIKIDPKNKDKWYKPRNSEVDLFKMILANDPKLKADPNAIEFGKRKPNKVAFGNIDGKLMIIYEVRMDLKGNGNMLELS